MASLNKLFSDPCKSMWNSSVKLDLFSSAIFKVLFSAYFGLFSLDYCVICRALVKLTASGFSSKTSTTSSSAGLVGRLLVSLESSALESSSSASTSASSRGVQSGFIRFLGEIHFVQTFCQLAQRHSDVRRVFILYFLERTCIQFHCRLRFQPFLRTFGVVVFTEIYYFTQISHLVQCSINFLRHSCSDCGNDNLIIIIQLFCTLL